MEIAWQCQLGQYKNRENWIPECAWGEDVYVQWGGSGIVFAKEGNYLTAFFEAFPQKPEHKTFIRGEGETIQEAEKAAFVKYEKMLACPEHEFERRDYDNGAGICKHCGMFKSKAFPPHKICHHCGKAIWEGFDDKHGNLFCGQCEEDNAIPEEDWTDSYRKYKKEMEEHDAFLAERGIDVKERRRKMREAEDE